MTTQIRPILLGIRYDEHSSFLRGAADAPPPIRVELWSPHSSTWTERGIDLSMPGMLSDAGDIAPSGDGAIEVIEQAVANLLDGGANPVTIGGDHTVTYPVLRAFAGKYPRLTILHFDAHPDLYDVFEGDRLSHACPFARVMEEGLAQRLVQVGIRCANAHQREQAERFGVEMFEMRNWREALAVSYGTPVYISFDIDGLDPSCAPGVSHREPGGLQVRDALDVIHRVETPVIGADVVEYNPHTDIGGVTATVAAKLVKEIVGQMHLTNR